MKPIHHIILAALTLPVFAAIVANFCGFFQDQTDKVKAEPVKLPSSIIMEIPESYTGERGVVVCVIVLPTGERILVSRYGVSGIHSLLLPPKPIR